MIWEYVTCGVQLVVATLSILVGMAAALFIAFIAFVLVRYWLQQIQYRFWVWQLKNAQKKVLADIEKAHAK